MDRIEGQDRRAVHIRPLSLLTALVLLACGSIGLALSEEPVPYGGWTQENNDLESGPGIEGHWNLTDLIGSRANAFDSVAEDVDGDGQWEIVVSRGAQCEFYCLEQDGTVLWQTPLLSEHTPGYYGSDVVDLDGDGALEFVAVADSIWVREAATGKEKWTVPDVGAEPDETPWILGHVSSPDRWDIIIARAKDLTFVISVYDWTGDPVWTEVIEDASYGHTISVEDIDADGLDEVFVACSKKTVAFDHDGRRMWSAPLVSSSDTLSSEVVRQHDLRVTDTEEQVEGWWYHSDFVEIADLRGNGQYYVLHDYGGGASSPTTVQVLDALSGEVVDSFVSAGHLQWLKAAELYEPSPGQEIVYVTRETVVMRSSELAILWEKELSGAHELGIGDWDGNEAGDIIVSTVFRGYETFAALDSNFVVYDGQGNVLYNMQYEYPGDAGKYAGAQMHNAMKQTADLDGDGRIEVPVCFSNHDEGKFDSSQDVHQYVMGMKGTSYTNLYNEWANDSETSTEQLAPVDGSLRLSYLVPTQEVTPTSETVLLMHMNEGAGDLLFDSSLHHNDGTLIGGEWVDEGSFFGAVRFDSPGDACTVPFTSSLTLEHLTIEVWLQVSDISTPRYVVEKPGSFGLYITSQGYLSFYIQDSTASRGQRAHVETTFPGGEEYTHVVATYDGMHLRLIVNGTEKVSDSHVGVIDDSGSDLLIGNSLDMSMPLRGTMDELRISRTLTPSSYVTTGNWTSTPIVLPGPYSHYGTLQFNDVPNGGSITYDLVDEEGSPIPGHEGITASPHDIADVTEPLRVRVYLTAGPHPYLSPQVEEITLTRSDVTLSPGLDYWASPYSSFSYTHTISRTGPGGDTLFLSVSAPDEWAPLIEPVSATLSSGEALTVRVTVQVPVVTLQAQTVISITATSGLASVPVSVSDRVHVLFRGYLPVIATSQHDR